MATHHLKAVGLGVDWHPLETFPKDGSIVEVRDADGIVCKAQWHSERILSSSLTMIPTAWRPPE